MTLTEQDRLRIRSAVQEAERRTRGEIVPMIVPASGHYREVQYLLGLGGAFAILAFLITLDPVGWGWSTYHPGWILLLVMLGCLIGMLIGSRPYVIRSMASPTRMERKVRFRAERAFFEHGLHRTREGTGILIMVSLLERRVQILADKAIDEKVPSGTWDTVVANAVADIRKRTIADSLCRAIAECGDLLARHFPPGRENPDELSDDVVQDP